MTEVALTDSELKNTCFGALTAAVGHVGMERFIVLLNREPRDYTKWRETHFCDEGETLDQLAGKIRAYVPPRRRTAATPVRISAYMTGHVRAARSSGKKAASPSA